MLKLTLSLSPCSSREMILLSRKAIKLQPSTTAQLSQLEGSKSVAMPPKQAMRSNPYEDSWIKSNDLDSLMISLSLKNRIKVSPLVTPASNHPITHSQNKIVSMEQLIHPVMVGRMDHPH